MQHQLNSFILINCEMRVKSVETKCHDVQNDRRSHRNKRKMKIKVKINKKCIASMNQGIQIMLKSSLKRYFFFLFDL
jgi:hypothetical protein